MPTPDASVFAKRPWRLIEESDFAGALAVPTMLNWQQSQFYYWLGRDWARNWGVAVDLGCFAGGSTARLAAGLAASGSDAPVHAYDRFGASDQAKSNVLYPAGIDPFDGEDIRPLAERLLAPWSDRVHLHGGEITEQRWDGSTIEILVMDASKRPKTMDRMAQTFWPSIISDRTIVVQPDVLHHKQPWVATQMALWADHFEPVAWIGRSSVAYLCTRTPTPDKLRNRRVAGMDPARQERLLEKSVADMARFGADAAEAAERTLKTYLANPGVDMAWKMKEPE